MNIETFRSEFGALMTRAIAGPEIPLQGMILELDIAHRKMQDMLLAFEAHQAASRIMPANGRLPPHRP